MDKFCRHKGCFTQPLSFADRQDARTKGFWCDSHQEEEKEYNQKVEEFMKQYLPQG